jgi:hypothetical protein
MCRVELVQAGLTRNTSDGGICHRLALAQSDGNQGA